MQQLDQLTHADTDAEKFDVHVHDYLVPKELFIAADAPTGRVWCWQVDAKGNKLKTVEVKTGTVTISEHTDEVAEPETSAEVEAQPAAQA